MGSANAIIIALITGSTPESQDLRYLKSLALSMWGRFLGEFS